MLNLTLAILWAVIGVGLIVYHATTGAPHGRMPMFGNLSPGWAALLISLYNLVRWWSRRVLLANQQAEWRDRARRARRGSGPPPEYGDPNPDFMFGDEPPPKK